MKRRICYKGQIMNKFNVAYVSEIQTEPGIRRTCLFECACGKTFVSLLNDVVQNKRRSCGCRKGNKPYHYKPGEYINGIKFLRSKGTVNYAQRAIFECPVCKNDWESYIANVKEGNSKSCCKLKRGWSKTQWQKFCKKAKLYKVLLFNDRESFIKIGITSKSIEKRLKGLPYNFKIIKYIEGDSGYIFDLENRIKKIFKKYSYTPEVRFKGETECYHYKN
jgi:hypothetical protein